jgi:hypothetical protein
VNGLVEMNDEQTERIVENLAEVDWDTIDFWELEEIFEDRDPTEFL